MCSKIFALAVAVQVATATGGPEPLRHSPDDDSGKNTYLRPSRDLFSASPLPLRHSATTTTTAVAKTVIGHNSAGSGESASLSARDSLGDTDNGDESIGSGIADIGDDRRTSDGYDRRGRLDIHDVVSDGFDDNDDQIATLHIDDKKQREELTLGSQKRSLGKEGDENHERKRKLKENDDGLANISSAYGCHLMAEGLFNVFFVSTSKLHVGKRTWSAVNSSTGDYIPNRYIFWDGDSWIIGGLHPVSYVAWVTPADEEFFDGDETCFETETLIIENGGQFRRGLLSPASFPYYTSCPPKLVSSSKNEAAARPAGNYLDPGGGDGIVAKAGVYEADGDAGSHIHRHAQPGTDSHPHQKNNNSRDDNADDDDEEHRGRRRHVAFDEMDNKGISVSRHQYLRANSNHENYDDDDDDDDDDANEHLVKHHDALGRHPYSSAATGFPQDGDNDDSLNNNNNNNQSINFAGRSTHHHHLTDKKRTLKQSIEAHLFSFQHDAYNDDASNSELSTRAATGSARADPMESEMLHGTNEWSHGPTRQDMELIGAESFKECLTVAIPWMLSRAVPGVVYTEAETRCALLDDDEFDGLQPGDLHCNFGCFPIHGTPVFAEGQKHAQRSFLGIAQSLQDCEDMVIKNYEAGVSGVYWSGPTAKECYNVIDAVGLLIREDPSTGEDQFCHINPNIILRGCEENCATTETPPSTPTETEGEDESTTPTSTPEDTTEPFSDMDATSTKLEDEQTITTMTNMPTTDATTLRPTDEAMTSSDIRTGSPRLWIIGAAMAFAGVAAGGGIATYAVVDLMRGKDPDTFQDLWEDPEDVASSLEAEIQSSTHSTGNRSSPTNHVNAVAVPANAGGASITVENVSIVEPPANREMVVAGRGR